MKKHLTIFVLLAFIFVCSGCQLVQQQNYRTDPFPTPTLDTSAPTTFIIIGAVVLTTALVIGIVREHDNLRQFEKFGRHVSYLMHQEAPVTARFLGDVECQEDSQTDVKNMLRIKAAKLGGNLLVIDAITESRDSTSIMYSGSGRVYLLAESPPEIRQVF